MNAAAPGTGKAAAGARAQDGRADLGARRRVILAVLFFGAARCLIVVAAARDEASGQLEETAVRALRSIGAREDLRGHLRVSHVVIGVKGAGAGEALEPAGPALLRVSVGLSRPLGTVLESFELR